MKQRNNTLAAPAGASCLAAVALLAAVPSFAADTAPTLTPVAAPAASSQTAPRRPTSRNKSRTAPPPNTAFDAADAGYKAYDRRDYDGAVSQATRATQLAPGNRAYWLLLVNSLIASGRLAQAQEAVDTGVRLAGDDGSLAAQRDVIRKGQALEAGTAMYAALQKGDNAAAINAARTAVGHAPDNAGYRLALVSLLLQSGEFAQAETMASETVALLPDSAAPLAMRAYARQRLGRWQEARADHDRALQQRLSPAAQRDLRLIAADAALAAAEPQRALDLLAPLPASDGQVSARRVLASQALPGTTPQMVVAFNAMPPPGIDCSSVATTQTCALIPAQPARNPAFEAADAAYKAMAAKNYSLAADSASQAVAAAPANRDYQLLLMNALREAGRTQEAEAAASAALALQPGDAQLLVQRSALRKELGDTAGSAQDARAALALGTLEPGTEIGLLQDLGRQGEARARFEQARAANTLGNMSQVDQAYLASRMGDDRAAQQAFAQADKSGSLPESALQDAAYSSLRVGDDDQAVAYFKRTIDAADALKLRMDPQMRFDTRRAVSEITRRWGALVSLAYSSGSIVPGFGIAPGAAVGNNVLQAGTEFYWRPWGFMSGRYVELFARAFTTLYSQAGNATGADSVQAALGIRWKPLTTQNAVLSLSRVFTRNSQDDWLGQAAYSYDHGTDLRVDRDSWWTARAAAEVGHYFESGQTYGLASAQAGRSFRMNSDNGRAVLFPHAVAAAEYNSIYADRTTVGAGPGVSLRYWFREDKYAAPHSYIDFSLQYRARIAGDQRGKGLFFTTLLSY